MRFASRLRVRYPACQARRRARLNIFMVLVDAPLQALIAIGVFPAVQIFALPAHHRGFPRQPMTFERQIHHLGLVRPGAPRQLGPLLEHVSRSSQFGDGRDHFSS